MEYIKNISFFLVISVIVSIAADYIESYFIFKYLKEQLLTVLLTLLAINTATSSLIASKMQDLMIQYPKINFRSSIKEMKISLLEQIILIVVALLCLFFMDSEKIIFNYKTIFFNSILLTILIYAINIL